MVYLANFKLPFHLFADAAAGLGCASHLAQWDNNKKCYLPIAWKSHLFGPSERNLSQIHAELFSIIHGLTSHPFLCSFSTIIVHNDCRSLSYLLKYKDNSAKLERFLIILQSYNLYFLWEPSNSPNIKLVDFFSRVYGTKMNEKPKRRRLKKEDDYNIPDMNFPQITLFSFPEIEKLITKKLFNQRCCPPDQKETKGEHLKLWEDIEICDITETRDYIKYLEETVEKPPMAFRANEYRTIKQDIELATQHANGFQRIGPGRQVFPGLENGLEPPQHVLKTATSIKVDDNYIKIQTQYHYFPEIEEYPDVFQKDDHVDLSSKIGWPDTTSNNIGSFQSQPNVGSPRRHSPDESQQSQLT